jgi:4-amino-4-deoxy-L-arabinose transferase-like glycosyltransferase
VAAVILQLYVMADQDDPRPLRWAALGASVALAAYTRSEGILLFVFLVVPLTFRWPWSPEQDWRR